MLDKNERLSIFLKRIEAAVPAKSENDAYELLANTLNEVENEHTTIPYNPAEWMSDGRMYPPQSDNRKVVSENIVRYRNKNHYTYIGANGAIRIEKLNGRVALLDKPGSDGQKIGDL